MNIKYYLKSKPRLFDISKRIYRYLPGNKDNQYHFFDNFSKSLHKHVTFIQIGASDGLRWDPIREFVIRDRWSGTLVEPLPFAFQQLKDNYKYIHNSKLEFVNAAITSEKKTSLSFWTFNEDFMDKLSLEDRITFSQKSSFYKEHVERWIKLNGYSDNILKEIKVPCMTFDELFRSHCYMSSPDLIVIDAEGHESTIIPNIDLTIVKPKAIFFESHNLGDEQDMVFKYLDKHGYQISQIGGDSIAMLTQ